MSLILTVRYLHLKMKITYQNVNFDKIEAFEIGFGWRVFFSLSRFILNFSFFVRNQLRLVGTFYVMISIWTCMKKSKSSYEILYIGSCWYCCNNVKQCTKHKSVKRKNAEPKLQSHMRGHFDLMFYLSTVSDDKITLNGDFSLFTCSQHPSWTVQCLIQYSFIDWLWMLLRSDLMHCHSWHWSHFAIWSCGSTVKSVYLKIYGA